MTISHEEYTLFIGYIAKGDGDMVNYKKLYTTLFNAITDALEDMGKQNYGLASERLMHAQLATETLYITSGSKKRKSKEEGPADSE